MRNKSFASSGFENTNFHECICSIGLNKNETIPLTALTGEKNLIGYRIRIEDHCDWTFFRSCVGQCVIYFPQLFNNFDLNFILPTNVNGKSETLNQRLCKNIKDKSKLPSQVKLYSSIKCNVNELNIDLQKAIYVSNDLMISKEKISCK